MAANGHRHIVAAMLLSLCTACTFFAISTVDYWYYAHGPEAALAALDAMDVPPGAEPLAELERAMILLELGHYTESLDCVRRARTALAEAATDAGAEAPLTWVPEIHERVLPLSLEIADLLALQDVEAAADAAVSALKAIKAARCDECRFTFTRVISAIAFAEAERWNEGLAALDGVTASGPAADLVESLRGELAAGVTGAQPEGIAPPPAGERRLTVLLLLGRGPVKQPERLQIDGESIPWVRYLPDSVQAVTWAAIEADDPEVSIPLTDVDEVAAAGLRRRASDLAASWSENSTPPIRDLRTWASLPSSLQLLEARIARDRNRVDLVYFSPDGFEVDRETIEVPREWLSGRIFVVRRMP